MQPEKPNGFRLHLGPPMEKAMAPHSSTLTWRILWTEDPGGLQSMGSQSWTRLSTARQGPASDQGEAVSETGREEGADGGPLSSPTEPACGWSWCTLALPAAAETQGSVNQNQNKQLGEQK